MPDNKDSENLVEENIPDDVTSMFGALGSDVVKMALFLFLYIIFLCSDVFIDRVLSTSDNRYVEGGQITDSGVFVQGILLSIGYIIMHVLISHEFI